MQAAVDAAKEAGGGLKISVCCAGTGWAQKVAGPRGPHPLMPFETIIAINLIGTFNVLRSRRRRCSRTRRARTAARRVRQHRVDRRLRRADRPIAYSASKGGVVGMTLPAARDCRARHPRGDDRAPACSTRRCWPRCRGGPRRAGQDDALPPAPRPARGVRLAGLPHRRQPICSTARSSGSTARCGWRRGSRWRSAAPPGPRPRDAGRLLHAFNIEYGEASPEPDALAARLGELTADGRHGGAARRRRAGRGGRGAPAQVAVDRGPGGLPRRALRGSRRARPRPRPRPAARGDGRRARTGAGYIDLNTSEADTAARGLYEATGFSSREGRPDGPATSTTSASCSPRGARRRGNVAEAPTALTGSHRSCSDRRSSGEGGRSMRRGSVRRGAVALVTSWRQWPRVRRRRRPPPRRGAGIALPATLRGATTGSSTSTDHLRASISSVTLGTAAAPGTATSSTRIR